MSKIIAVSLFYVLLFATMLGLSMSLAPGVSVKNAYLYAIIAFLVLRSVVQRSDRGGVMDEPIPLVTIHFCFVGLIFWAILSLLYMTFMATHIRYDGLRGMISLKGAIVDIYLIFIAFYFTIREKEDVVWAVKAIVSAAALYNAIVFVDVFTPLDFGLIQGSHDEKVWGPMGHANQYGCFLAFFTPSMVALAVSSRGLQRALFAAGAAISFILLVATLARAAYLGLFIGLLISVFVYRSYLPLAKYFRYSVLAIPVALVLMLVFGQWDAFYERVIETTNRASGIDDLSSGRLGIWGNVIARQAQSALGMFLGMGWDAHRQSLWFRLSAHNTYLRIYFELGIIGVSLYFGILLAALRVTINAFKQATEFDQRLLLGFTVGLCSFIVFLFFDQLSVVFLLVWAYIGVMLKFAFLVINGERVSSQ